MGVTCTSIKKVYQQCREEWVGWCACRVHQTMLISALKSADFSFTYIMLEWLGR